MDVEALAAAWTVVVPLVEADGGELYLVRQTSTEIYVHLAGSCAGCPGSAVTEQHLFVPVFRKYAPKAALKLTTGWVIPAGSKRIRVEGGVVKVESSRPSGGSRSAAP